MCSGRVQGVIDSCGFSRWRLKPVIPPRSVRESGDQHVQINPRVDVQVRRQVACSALPAWRQARSKLSPPTRRPVGAPPGGRVALPSIGLRASPLARSSSSRLRLAVPSGLSAGNVPPLGRGAADVTDHALDENGLESAPDGDAGKLRTSPLVRVAGDAANHGLDGAGLENALDGDTRQLRASPLAAGHVLPRSARGAPARDAEGLAPPRSRAA